MAMGDRVAVMNGGILQQVGPPEDIYRDPVNEFVADFIGSPSINLFTADIEGSTLRGPGGFSYELDDTTPVKNIDRVRVGIRPEDFTVVEDTKNSATVTVVEPMGNENFLYMTLGSHEITARVDPAIRPQEGETVGLSFEETALYLFDPHSGESLKTKSDSVDVELSTTVND